MTGTRKGDDRGFILPATLVAITLMAFAALLTGRTIGTLLRASVQESLAVKEHATIQTVTGIIDSWMADQQVSSLLQSADSRIVGVWRTPLGADCVWGKDTTCWRIDADDPSTPEDEGPKWVFLGNLRGGEAERQALAMTATVVVGCYGSTEDACQRTHSFTRNYERAVFSQYQLHYDTNAIPPEALNGPDGQPNDPAVCNDLNTPSDPILCDDLDPATVIVFTSDDNLNGPLRTTLTQVLHCGNPTFSRIEVSGNNPDPDDALVDVDCGYPTTASSIVSGGDLELPPLEGFSLPSNGVCALDSIDYAHLFAPVTAAGLRGDNCPGGPGDPTHAVIDGDIISAGGDITIEHLTLNGSVTIHAEGDIIICGDIEASGTNPAGGPNVIALITEGNVVLDPSGSIPPECADDTLAELNTSHNLTLTNIAILAPNGAVYARRWHLPHAPTGGPTLTIEGSIAAKHLGLYATPDILGGAIDGGWSKTFTYPTGFWQARPPWWPGLDGSEWAPIGEPGSASGTPAPGPPVPTALPGIYINPVTVTVTEGSAASETFVVNLTAQPLTNVTVQLDSLIFLTNPSTLRFTSTDWDTPQIVRVKARHDDDSSDAIYVVTAMAVSADGGYNGLAEEMRVTVVDDDIPGLVLAPASLSINENGAANFDVSLETSPSAPVTVTVSSSDLNAATAAPLMLTFTSSNHTTPQTVTVSGVDDLNADDESLNILLSTASTDTDYDTLTGSVSVLVTDDETHGLVGVPDTLAVNETGTTTFNVSLTAQPSADVSVTTYSLTTSAVTVNPSPLTFTTTDWGTPQTITVTGEDDANMIDETVSVVILAANGGYDGVTETISVTATDDDVIGCAVIQSLTAAQLSDVVSVTAQGAWLTGLHSGQLTGMAINWSNNNTLTIPAQSLSEVTLAGSPPIVITDTTLLDSITLGAISSSEAYGYLRGASATWLVEAQNTGSVQIAGTLVDSVVVGTNCP